MNMYEEHAMTAIYMDAEMSHHGDPGTAESTESYHPGLVIEQLNKVIAVCTLLCWYVQNRSYWVMLYTQ